MRHFCLSVILMLFLFSGLFAQDYTRDAFQQERTYSPYAATEKSHHNNIIKINPGKLLLGGINASYERSIRHNRSINFRMKYHPMGFAERTMDYFTISGENYRFNLTDKPSVQHFGTDLEYRFYLKNKKPGQGFYVAPYVRYLYYGCSFNSDYEGTLAGFSAEINAYITTAFHIPGAGVQAGAHWKIGNRVSIDWSFAGISIDRHTFKVNAASENMELMVDKYSSDLQLVAAGVNGFLAKKLALYAVDKTLVSKKTYWLPGWKSNLSIGIAF